MKMRTFIATLLLFSLFFNAAIMMISHIILKEKLNQVQERCLAEHYIIASSVIKDLQSLEARGAILEDSIADIMSAYARFSQNKKMSLSLYQDDTPIFTNMGANVDLSFALDQTSPSENSRKVFLQKENAAILYVTGRLPAPYEEYTLIYRYNIEESIAAWRQLKNTLFFMGILLIAILAFCLLFLLERIFRPLRQIAEASGNIASGNYEKRLPVLGSHEVAHMSQSFNHMAAEIENRVEELHEAAEQKQQFIDNFAHELRTPLTAIYGYAEYIQKASISEKDKIMSTGYIMSECKRMQNMAYELLDLAMLRIDEIELTWISLPKLFQSIENIMHPKAAAKQIAISYTHEIESLFGNEDLLENLLTNLIDNAIKASPPHAAITVHGCKEDDHNIISVKDNGNGMSEEQLLHIKEAFYRTDKSRSRKDGNEGVGLGLTICEQIVQLHHGELQFISKIEQGTTVKVIFTTSS